MCFYLLMGSVLVVHVLLDFGSLFLVLILHLGMLAAVSSWLITATVCTGGVNCLYLSSNWSG
jgi:hypothetical protein